LYFKGTGEEVKKYIDSDNQKSTVLKEPNDNNMILCKLTPKENTSNSDKPIVERYNPDQNREKEIKIINPVDFSTLNLTATKFKIKYQLIEKGNDR